MVVVEWEDAEEEAERRKEVVVAVLRKVSSWVQHFDSGAF
jgi:hypothetical protein